MIRDNKREPKLVHGDKTLYTHQIGVISPPSRKSQCSMGGDLSPLSGITVWGVHEDSLGGRGGGRRPQYFGIETRFRGMHI
jgi:hypothetical protein